MDNSLYDMIFKRKSFHLFRGIGDETISDKELSDIEKYFDKLVPLDPNIKVKIKDNFNFIYLFGTYAYIVLYHITCKFLSVNKYNFLVELLNILFGFLAIGTRRDKYALCCLLFIQGS